MKLVINFILFQIGWFSCVLGAANGFPWLGPIVVAAVCAIHLALAPRAMDELRLILAAMGMGLITDSLMMATGWLSYPNGILINGLAPYWIVAMWALFATTLNVSMTWMKGRLLVAVVFGGIGGALSYLAGYKLGAMSLSPMTPALVVIGIGWAIAMPLLVLLSNRFDGISPVAETRTTSKLSQVSSHA